MEYKQARKIDPLLALIGVKMARGNESHFCSINMLYRVGAGHSSGRDTFWDRNAGTLEENVRIHCGRFPLCIVG
jgi:hypothetical protein